MCSLCENTILCLPNFALHTTFRSQYLLKWCECVFVGWDAHWYESMQRDSVPTGKGRRKAGAGKMWMTRKESWWRILYWLKKIWKDVIERKDDIWCTLLSQMTKSEASSKPAYISTGLCWWACQPTCQRRFDKWKQYFCGMAGNQTMPEWAAFCRRNQEILLWPLWFTMSWPINYSTLSTRPYG